MVISIFGGIILFSAISIKTSLKYMNNMVDAAKSLSHPDENPIELPAELTDVQNELNLAREQALRNIDIANDAVRRKNDLIMYLAHDLKTPLASVIGYLNLLRDEGQISDELREKYLSVSLEKAERLEDLINEFFEIARFNLSTVSLQYSKINLTRLLEQLTYEFKPMLQEKNLHCKLDVDGDIMLRCDADKIQRVLDNLLRNAVIYSYENTEIEITAQSRGEEIIITFLNFGDTIPAEKLDRIFEQFYRLDAARRTSGGAGLGLAIARQIAELHNGKITAKSEQDKIVFEVTLPIS
ncbi:MAG: HAMP domain-containing histidine kinase [Eubacterium sp.]|nr:HAMP domain-containing histidine kinase [Eubacterium sp.]